MTSGYMKSSSISKRKKMDKLYLMKIKNFCSAKDSVQSMKNRATNWKKVFANHKFNKEFLYEIHKEISKLNNKESIL